MVKREISRIKKNKIVGELWGGDKSIAKRYGGKFHWVESPIVMSYINNNITGDPNLDWVTYVFRKYLRKSSGALKVLSLGCGAGNLERHLINLGPFRKIDACDISDGAIKGAKIEADRAGIKVNYFKVDLNTINLPRGRYDVVIANMSLHHIEELEHLLGQINGALTKDGLFILNEFVGPSQFQYSKKQVEIINDVLDLLPPLYRVSVTNPDMLKPFYAPSSVEYMDDNDPSEAIRSEEIIKLVGAKFEIVEHHDYGGTILHMLLQDIVGNFDPDNVGDSTALRLVLYLESRLIKEKIIKSDFAFLVVRKKVNLWTQVLFRTQSHV